MKKASQLMKIISAWEQLDKTCRRTITSLCILGSSRATVTYLGKLRKILQNDIKICQTIWLQENELKAMLFKVRLRCKALPSTPFVPHPSKCIPYMHLLRHWDVKIGAPCWLFICCAYLCHHGWLHMCTLCCSLWWLCFLSMLNMCVLYDVCVHVFGSLWVFGIV